MINFLSRDGKGNLGPSFMPPQCWKTWNNLVSEMFRNANMYWISSKYRKIHTTSFDRHCLDFVLKVSLTYCTLFVVIGMMNDLKYCPIFYFKQQLQRYLEYRCSGNFIIVSIHQLTKKTIASSVDALIIGTIPIIHQRVIIQQWSSIHHNYLKSLQLTYKSKYEYYKCCS